MFNDILEKYAVTDKTNPDRRVLSRETAMEACTELYSAKNSADGFDAQEATRKVFGQIW